MEKTGFTPGPWLWQGEDDTSVRIFSKTDEHALAVVHSYWNGKGPSRQARNANGRLIAAAPELYEALKEFIGAVDSGTTFADQSVIQAARSALSKVEG